MVTIRARNGGTPRKLVPNCGQSRKTNSTHAARTPGTISRQPCGSTHLEVTAKFRESAGFEKRPTNQA